MAQNINDNLRLHAPKLLDDRAGPYASVAAALAGIPAYQRVEGLEVIIEVGGVQKKYWFDGGIADVDLVEIPSGGAGGYEPKNSIEVDAGELQLVGDEASPGNSKYYGTDGAGAKGFHDLPAGGGGGHTIKDTDGTALTQRDTLKFKGYLTAVDNPTSEETEADIDPTTVEDIKDIVDNSIEVNTGKIQLVGDAAAPGNNKVYGTDASGVKGWKADPAGTPVSSIDDLTDVDITGIADLQILKWDAATSTFLPVDDSGGHTIKNSAGTALTQRETLKFKGYLTATDNGTSEETEADIPEAMIEDYEMVDVYGVSEASQALLEDTGNWTSKEYTGTEITDCEAGMTHYDDDYLYLFVETETGNKPIRIARI